MVGLLFFVFILAAVTAFFVWEACGGVQRFKDQIDRERRLAELTPIVDHEDLS